VVPVAEGSNPSAHPKESATYKQKANFTCNGVQ